MVLALVAAGAAMQMYGQYQANMAQAENERQNAEMYRKQAQMVLEAQWRQESISRTNYAQAVGAQYSAYAKGGVDISGSASSTIAGTIAQGINEISAIRKKGALDYELARMRGVQSDTTAGTLSSSGYNLTQAAATTLSAAAMYQSYKGSASTGKGTP